MTVSLLYKIKLAIYAKFLQTRIRFADLIDGQLALSDEIVDLSFANKPIPRNLRMTG